MMINFLIELYGFCLSLRNDAGRKVALYSIHSNPLFNPYHFIVSGRDPFVRIFDRRFLVGLNNDYFH